MITIFCKHELLKNIRFSHVIIVIKKEIWITFFAKISFIQKHTTHLFIFLWFTWFFVHIENTIRTKFTSIFTFIFSTMLYFLFDFFAFSSVFTQIMICSTFLTFVICFVVHTIRNRINASRVRNTFVVNF